MEKVRIVNHNVKKLNHSTYSKTFEVKVFSKSEELSYLKRLVDKSRYDDTVVFDKLFFRYNNNREEHYLKNKYLYLTTRGIISYLGARDEDFSNQDGDFIFQYIDDLLKKDNESKINVISLGAADSIKESRIFARFSQSSLERINYIPVDVSPMLIQLGINNFSAKKVFKKLNVSSIVSDIWHLADYIQKSENDSKKTEKRKQFFGEGKRVFLLLGSTFGSYEESDFLSQVVELMAADDSLLLGFQKIEDKDSESSLYSDPDFLLAPLTYIPYFYGYSQYSSSFLKTISGAHNDNISDIPTSLSTVHYIYSERERRSSNKSLIYLTWNTRYVPKDLVAWIGKFSVPGHQLEASCSCDNNGPNIVVVTKKQDKESQSPDIPGYRPVPHSLNHSVYFKSFEVKVFSDSEELSFLHRINKEREYIDKQVFFKLFNQYENKDVKSDYYLKNKYLYVTTNGILDYLRLYEAQQVSLQDFFDFEKSELREIIFDLLEQVDKGKEKALNIVSLGAAISDKEAAVLQDIIDKPEYVKAIKYYPVDISPMLIQLGINVFSSSVSFEELDVKSIVADFWSLADYIREDGKQGTARRASFFGKGKRLFIVLGGTFGNYSEGEFLDQIVEMMDEGDELMISVKLLQENRNYSPDLDYKNLPGNEGFLLEPLTFIPLYSGYSKYYRDYLITDSRSNLSEGDEELEFVSVIPKSESTAPYIEIDRIDGGMGKSKVRLAWSTRYDSTALKDWFSHTYKLGEPGKEIYKLEFCKDSKGNIWNHREQIRNNYSVMRLKKVRVQYGKEILHILSDYSLDTDHECMAVYRDLEKRKLLDKDLYDKIVGANRRHANKKRILEHLLAKQAAR